MKIKTKWSRNSSSWDLSAEIDTDGKGSIIYTYLANIESVFGNHLEYKLVYVVTDLFGDYHPESGSYFGDKEFARLKDAKVWAEKEVVKGLSEIVKQVKGLGK